MGNFLSTVKNIFKSIFRFFKNAFIRLKNSIEYGPLYRIKNLTEIQIKNTKKLNIPSTLTKKILMPIICLAVIVGLVFVFKYIILVFEGYVLLKGIPPAAGNPLFFNYLIFVLGIYLIVSVIDISVKLISTLYKAQDNAILIAYPVNPGEIFISKLLVVYIKEFKKALFVIIPFLIGFYIQKHAYYSLNYTYFFGVFYAFIFIPLFLTLVSGCLSLIFCIIDSFFKKYPIFKFIVVTLVTIAAFILLIFLLSKLPTNLKLADLWSKIVDDVSLFVGNVDPYFISSSSICAILNGKYSSDVGTGFLVTISTLVIFGILIVFVCYRFFFKVSFSAKEIKTSVTRVIKDKEIKIPFVTFFRKELKTFARSEEGFIATLFFIIVLPLLIFTLNKIFGIMFLSAVGKKIVFSVNVLLCITVLTASNITAANALSREGAQFYLLKISPINTKTICYAKMLVHLILNSVSLILVGIALKVSSSMGANTANIYNNWDVAMIVIVSFLISSGHLLWSFELDLSYPKVRQYIAGEKDTSNLTKSLFIGLGLAIATTLVMVLFLFVFKDSRYSFKELDSFNFKWISILIFAVLFLVSRIILFIKKINVKFEEIQY